MSDGTSQPLAEVEGRRSFSNAAEYLESQRGAASPQREAAPQAATAADEDDDDDALLGIKHDAAAKEAVMVPVPVAVVPPPPPPPAPSLLPENLKMADLFGTFQPARNQSHAEDPQLFDVMQVCHDAFGPSITELEVLENFHIDVDTDDHRLHVVTEHKRLDDVQPFIDAFGDHAIDFFAKDIIAGGDFEHARVVECMRPANPFSAAVRPGRDEVWLMDMAKVQPNRQVLHLAPKPFDKNSALKPENTKRDFFTPQSCIQWARSKTGRVLSNARIVRWSDGSATLHVGADVYELPQNNERVLAMVARRSVVADGRSFVEDNAFVEAVPVARHVTAIPARGRPSSVNEALVREVQDAQKGRDPMTSLAYSGDGVPVIRSDTERAKAPKKLREHPTDEERFLEIARENRARDMKRRGGQMTAIELINDELRAYEELCEATKGHTVAAMVRQRDADLKAERDKAKRAHMTVDADGNVVAVPRGKFDRDTGLQTTTGDAFDEWSNAAGSNATGGGVYRAEAEDDLLFGGGAPVRDGSNKRSRSRPTAPEGDSLAELEAQRSTIHMPARPEEDA